MKRSIIYILLLAIVTIHSLNAQPISLNEPINGISFLGPYNPTLSIDMFENLRKTNSKWVALIPEAILDRETLTLKADEENEHWGYTVEAQIEAIQLAQAAGLKIFLKPHIVLEKFDSTRSIFSQRFFSKKADKTNGALWRGTFKANNESDWVIWEKSYETYILDLATIAESFDVELFSIGAELKKFVIERPHFWQQLIKKVRSRYNGAITYSANWDEFDKVSFWADLDFVGVDAYFPINFSKTPSIGKTVRNWKPIKTRLESLSNTVNKKILMTEFGYRNVSFSGMLPWLHDKGNSSPNNKAQANLYEAFFRAFWKEPWIAGGFSWNWQPSDYQKDNTDFTIQNKPAFSILQKWYL